MRVVLTSEIPVVRIAVFAEMGWMERRPELGFLCRAARDNGNRITVATVQSALPGLLDAGANNVIAWCRTLGLCDLQGGLTSLGDDVAETDEAPIPEQGVYSLWLTQHPIIGRRVLAVERRTSFRDQRYDDVQSLPIEPDRNKVFRSVVDPKVRYQVRALPTNHGQAGCLIEKTQATCQLRWTLDFDASRDHWQLDGTVEESQGQNRYLNKPMEHMPESDGIDLARLANVWGNGPLSVFGRWQPTDRRLEVALKDLTHEEQASFRKTLKLDQIEVPGKGVFKGVTLENVPVGPVTAEDAQMWAMSLFSREMMVKPLYRSRSDVRQLFSDLVEGTPLEKHSPTLPAHKRLISEQLHTKNPEIFWSLSAPVDLAPRPIVAEELADLRIGVPSLQASQDLPGVIRVPYRGGWSMRQFVERTLAGVIPRKVLLCDRFVRGHGNLESLKIFAQSLRTIEPSSTFEIWTTDEEADFQQIHEITGSVPRTYQEVFDRNPPHDRYFLILPTKGAGFGWHMSNSPLHARADITAATPEAPLRWKDLAATRVAADGLDPVFRQWLTGGAR